MIDTTELVRELVYQIRLGEDSAYEFKAVTCVNNKVKSPHRDSIANEIAAFANTSGGIIVLGVEDKKLEVEGIEREQLDTVGLWLTSLVNDKISPPPLIETRLLEIPDRSGEQKAVIWVRVPKSLFIHESPNGYFQRVGSSKRKMQPDLLARLFQQRSMARLIRFDEQVVPSAPLEAIDVDLKERFVRDNELTEKSQLKKLYLVGEDDEKQEYLTVSGVLLLTTQPSDYLQSAWIQCVAYSGTERNAEFQQDAQECRESIDQQIHCAIQFVKRNMRVEAVKRPGRIDIPQYDLGAIYEAIVNAVAHRDYAVYGSKIRLHLFSDRLEIMTPGGLPNSLTVDTIDSNSITRNETLVNLLSRYYQADPVSQRQNIIERRGEGVPKIMRASEQLSTRRPLYEQADEVQAELKLTIYAASRDMNGLVEQFEEK
ncbi:RNA-binding domain-containing protein [uncultured Cocleimonas sp.]|uniref:RNA-binding domain-containing protein n=1 Tax=uncultured Cocleimonas sp. TaxID=1051587 RepID=UPI0026345781|nr:RNA-binding domain-containing protein [uncultured Cocleimonas sp.]